MNEFKAFLLGGIIILLMGLMAQSSRIIHLLDDIAKMNWSLVTAEGLAGQWPEDGTLCLFEDGSVGQCYSDL